MTAMLKSTTAKASLGERLREERERLGMSQPEFGRLAGTTKQTVFSWESGKTAPDGFQLERLASVGINVQYVVTGGGPREADGGAVTARNTMATIGDSAQGIGMKEQVSIGDRLRAERQRLELSQTALGELGGVTKKTQMLYESGERYPDAAYLAAIATGGADIQFIVTGSRSGSVSQMEAAERVLVDNYRRCNAEAKTLLLQTSTLLASRPRASERK